MKIIFLSNYYNHHQAFISNEINKQCTDYLFIETDKMSEERKKLGYHLSSFPDYVKKVSEYDNYTLIKLINNADAVIIGSAPEYLIEERKKQGKLIFRYSERILKKSEPIKYPIRYYRFHKNNPKDSNIYMLCASAYTSSDYAKFGLFKTNATNGAIFLSAKIMMLMN